jgi:hypothetical protein
MNLIKNSKLVGAHAFLSPSGYHWLNYDDDKLRHSFFQKKQAALGDKLHAFAQQAIELGVKLPDTGATLNMYINDAIGFRMSAEIPLFYSVDCFGTTDSIGIREEKGVMTLRISDLKTGLIAASMNQLLIYCGIFFFEYGSLFEPDKVHVILRIYQNDEVIEHIPDVPEILWVMDRIKTAAAQIAYLREED